MMPQTSAPVRAAGVNTPRQERTRAIPGAAAPRSLGTPDRLAGVDEHRGARHQACLLVRREKHDGPHQVFGHTDLLERNASETALPEVVPSDVRPVQVGLDESRRDGVDPDLVGCQLQGHLFGEHFDSRLGHAVVGQVGRRHLLSGGRHVDDSAMRPVLDHSTRYRLAHEEVALQVDVQNGVPLLLADVEERGPLQDSGVVDEEVDTAQELVGLADEARDVGGGVRGALHGDGTAPHLLDLTHGAVGVFAAAPEVDGHIGALPGQPERDTAADATRSARDENSPTF